MFAVFIRKLYLLPHLTVFLYFSHFKHALIEHFVSFFLQIFFLPFKNKLNCDDWSVFSPCLIHISIVSECQLCLHCCSEWNVHWWWSAISIPFCDVNCMARPNFSCSNCHRLPCHLQEYAMAKPVKTVLIITTLAIINLQLDNMSINCFQTPSASHVPISLATLLGNML